MARILIIEPHPEVRDLLVRAVGRLGHESIVDADVSSPAAVDVVLLEPADPVALRVASAMRKACGTATVCVSIYPPSSEAAALEPVAYLLKPFTLRELEHALAAALATAEPATAA